MLRLVATVLVATFGTVVAMAPAEAAPPKRVSFEARHTRPNIVAFVLDDIPKLDDRLLARLPNVREIFLEKGIGFSDFNGETPTCCPGRAGFLTGLHTHHHGVFRDGLQFKPGETIATALRKKGYRTIQVGKYLNEFEAIADKTPPGWSLMHGFGGGYYDYDLWTNGQRRHYGSRPRDYSTDVIARLAASAIGSTPRHQRLFAWITPYTFHKPWTVAPRHVGSKACSSVQPWQPPGYMEKDISDKPRYLHRLRRHTLAGYPLGPTCRGLLSFDQLVGRVVDRLKQTGRFKNTLLILTSDNGMNMGMHRAYADKKTPYATRVPFYVRWPRLQGAVPSTIVERIQNIDLAPTLCDIVGCSLGPYPTGQRHPDGRSFLDLLTGERSVMRRGAVLSSYRDPDAWVPRWWSVTTTGSSSLAWRGCAAASSGACRWLWVEYETGARELYDVSNGPCWAWEVGMDGDPCMLGNLAAKRKFAPMKKDLKAILTRLR